MHYQSVPETFALVPELAAAPPRFCQSSDPLRGVGSDPIAPGLGGGPQGERQQRRHLRDERMVRM